MRKLFGFLAILAAVAFISIAGESVARSMDAGYKTCMYKSRAVPESPWFGNPIPIAEFDCGDGLDWAGDVYLNEFAREGNIGETRQCRRKYVYAFSRRLVELLGPCKSL